MASSKDLQVSPRPLTHRPSIPNVANGVSPLVPGAINGFANRQPHSRTGSHSIIGAAFNSGHRVSRRKSMTNSGGTNVAAVAAMIQEADGIVDAKMAAGARRGVAVTKTGGGSGVVSTSLGGPMGGPIFPSRGTNAMAAALANAGTHGTIGSLPLPSPPPSLPGRRFVTADGSAIDDDMSDGEMDTGSLSLADAGAAAFETARIRRASDGQPLLKEGRRSSRMELRCTKCGKGYKHSSCLTKHLWEHTPGWALTSKLLISKHQQVQLLEAASVLVNMTQPTDVEPGANATATPPESARDSASEEGSESPIYGRSSVDTTPPPSNLDGDMSIDYVKQEPLGTSQCLSLSQRFAQKSGAGIGAPGFSRSYQSALPTGAAGAGHGFSHERQPSHDNLRPPSSGRNKTCQEDNELAAAVELLSCSFNSGSGDTSFAVTGSGSVRGVGQDVPPVPPVPVQYLGQSATPLGDTSFISSFPSRAPESFTRGERHSLRNFNTKVQHGSGDSLMDEDEDDRMSRTRSDDDEDGVFGRMEE